MAPEDPHDRYAATTGELRGWVRKRETPCWAITEIRPARNGTAIFVAGTNNADPAAPEPLRWVLDWHSFRDPAFVERRYDFSGAHFSRGAAAALLRVREEAAQLYTGEVRS